MGLLILGPGVFRGCGGGWRMRRRRSGRQKEGFGLDGVLSGSDEMTESEQVVARVFGVS